MDAKRSRYKLFFPIFCPQKLYRKVIFQLKFRFTSQKLQFQQVQTDCYESWISELGIGATVPMVYSQGRGAVAPQISNVDGTKKGGINFSVAEPEPNFFTRSQKKKI